LSGFEPGCYASPARPACCPARAPEAQEREVDFISRLSLIDVFIVLSLAGGIFAGFTQGMIRYALNGVVVILAFIVASQLKGPLDALLSGWDYFAPDLREQVLFLFLFIGLVVLGWFVVRVFYRRTRLPVARQVDEIGGAVLGLLFAALSIVFLVVVMDSFFQFASDRDIAASGFLGGLYDAMNDSVLVEYFRAALIPTFGFFARPFVPSEIAELLQLR
jgi:uncharacterized membrane protein required for colicin V production